MNDPLVAFLRTTDVFGGLAAEVLADLAPQLERLEVPAGEWVIRQGEPGDSVYFVVSGRVRAWLQVDGADTALNEMGPGDMLGELALLTDRPRTASVVAVRDSELLRLSADAFRSLVERHPAVVLAVARTVIDRLVERERSPVRRAGEVRTVAVVPAGARPDVAEFTEALTGALAAFGPAVRLRSGAGSLGSGASTAELHEMEQRHRFVVYEADAEPTEWSGRCLRQADRVLLVGDARSDPCPNEVEAELIGRAPSTTTARRDLVLLHDVAAALPRGTQAWLGPRAITSCHHVRRGRVEDHARLARSLAGRTVGLVLGGGGPRGFAHLGVMRALEEAGIPVDVVGGTSIGSIMGATLAMGWDHETRVRRALNAFVEKRLIGVTLPIVAMSSARKLTEALQEPGYFDDIRIEDLWTRYFCVSANISRADIVVHETGPVWRAIRASISLPGVMPPVYEDGDLLVDGGVIDNLPVDVMQPRVDGGTVIAVDLEPEVDLQAHQPFEATVSGWQVLASRLNPFAPSLHVPQIIDIIMRSKEIGGRRAQRRSVATSAVDLYLRPPTDGYGALDFKASSALVDVGYEYACAELERWGQREELAQRR